MEIKCDKGHVFEVGNAYPKDIDGKEVCPYCLTRRLHELAYKASDMEEELDHHRKKVAELNEVIAKQNDLLRNLKDTVDGVLTDLSSSRLKMPPQNTDDVAIVDGIPFSPLSATTEDVMVMADNLKT